MGASRGLQDNIPSIVKGSATTVTLAATNNGQPTRITIGGQQYKVASTLTMTTSTSGINGLDTGSIAANTLYYVYAVVSSSVIGLIASVTGPATGPTGFSNRYKLLGRFRTDLVPFVNTVAPDASIGAQGMSAAVDIAYTPRLYGASNSTEFTNYTATGFYRRIGDRCRASVRVSFGAAPATGTGGFLITGPGGSGTTYTTVNSSLIPSAAGGGNILGIAYGRDSSALSYDGTVVYQGTGLVSGFAVFALYASNGGASPEWTAASPFAWNTSDFISAEWEFPVLEWAGLFT